MSNAPEAFMTLRNEFARSLAVINVSSYILGIGDRHLENLLMDTEMATMVGIDFGYAFGIATSTLPVPEVSFFLFVKLMISVFMFVCRFSHSD